ncbi:hypothetical protein ACUX08_29885, partial [Salmonella enterica]
VIIAISIIGLIFDPAVKYQGLFAMPSLADADGKSLIFSLDIMGALQPVVLPSVLALVMTAVFDATGIRFRELPITSDKLREALNGPDAERQAAPPKKKKRG